MTNEAPHQSLRHCPSCGTTIETSRPSCAVCGRDLSTTSVVGTHDPEPHLGETSWEAYSSTSESPNAEVVSLPHVPSGPWTGESPGTESLESETPAEGDTDKRSRFGMTRKKLLTSVACVAAACLLGAGVFAYLHTRSDLANTRHRLKSTLTTLASTQGELKDTQASLTKTQGDLSTASHERDTLQASLNDANAHLNLQANQIETLKSCLGGITTALQDASLGNYTAAISTLDGVQVSCDEASKLF